MASSSPGGPSVYEVRPLAHTGLKGRPWAFHGIPLPRRPGDMPEAGISSLRERDLCTESSRKGGVGHREGEVVPWAVQGLVCDQDLSGNLGGGSQLPGLFTYSQFTISQQE